MPLKRCSDGKMHGWKWGDQGKCYQSKKDAIKQGVAIEGPEKFHQMAKTQFSGEELVLARIALNDAEKNHVKEMSFAEKVQAGLDELNPTKAYISAKTRNSIPDEDFAGDHKSFPIRDQHDVESAATLLHHAPDPSKVKRNIIRIAHKKGLKLPATWEHDGDKEEEKK